MNNIFKVPFYAKFALIAIGGFAFVYALYIGQHIILPIIFATIISILVNPVVNYLVKIKFNRVIAITITVLLTVLIAITLLYFIYRQLSLFSDSYPRLKEKFVATSALLIHCVSEHFNLKTAQINAWISTTQHTSINNMGGAIGQTLVSIKSIAIIIVLMPVYLFMILFYKPLLLEFMRKLFHVNHHVTVFEVLHNSKKIIQSYLFGLLVEAAIVATLNSIGLLILRIDYAIILGIIGAILNVIPYIGGITAITLPMIIAFVTKESSTYAILVLIIYTFIQFIDNHYIIPRIVASRVKINALISVIVVLLGAQLWGVPGMFLSIPLTAILKIIFDHIEPLKPWGFLLGNIVPSTQSKLKFNFIKRKPIV